MAIESTQAGSASPPHFMNATGWLGAVAVVSIVYYQFPKSRGFVGGFILLIVLGLMLSHYDTIKSQILQTVKG